ncbi:MAG: hypothetical protein EBZ06_08730 [Betaproteobacteria bacterium]|nr:hypothetical protein [Pseudomonadota bacterium]NBO12042.1 hypothetical protein [Betaproteobacteria bacterium]NBO45030.1 hypothetical protein [Betaproteobacteria bacterium]NBP09979.1 hypothetical protein [Betaproteobacteria bacterium]NBP60728.1 hypothetical protein [Betaproteobacteria bacterium]
MKLSPAHPAPQAQPLTPTAESARDALVPTRAADPGKAAAATASVSAQVEVRSGRMGALSDSAWINDPPALDTAMLDQIKSAIREGRFVINEQAIARALSEDASR